VNSGFCWLKCFGGDWRDIGYCVQTTSDGGYIIGGESDFDMDNISDCYLIKTDQYGDTIWTKNYRFTEYDNSCRSIMQTPDGGYIYTSALNSETGYNIFVVRLDENGDTLWTKIKDNMFLDNGLCIQNTNDGGFILCGLTGVSYDTTWAYVMKLDSIGNTTWSTVVDEEYSVAYHIQQNSDEGYVFTGYARTGDYMEWYKVYLVKLDSNGNVTWTNTFYEEGYDGNWGYCVRQLNNGGYIIAGTSGWTLGWNSTIYLIRTDSDGELIWKKRAGEVYSSGHCLLVTENENFVITGNFMSIESGLYLVKTNSDGDTLWTKTYEIGFNSWGLYLDYCQNEGYIITGYTVDASGSEDYDVILLQVDEEGNPIKNYVEVNPLTFTLHPPYPNPFNNQTIISFNLSKKSNVNLTVYDIVGREIVKLAEGIRDAGKYEVIFDGSDLASGIYLAKLEAGGYKQTQKLLLVK